LKTTGGREQIVLGIEGFLASVLPMAVSMTVTIPIRGIEYEHPLLQRAVEIQDVQMIFLIFVLAVAVAPLFEELLFRVILQPFLATLMPSSVAITVTAIAFSMVHGWRDAAALFPLAIILGYVFHRQHSYLSVVVLHGAFNATMLVLKILTSNT
jgi:membrane protease YdiL (CAAX protease family)